MSDDNTNTETITTTAAPAPVMPSTTQSPAPQGKTFTEEYVVSLREEAKANRLAKKNLETKLRTLIGLKEDEDIDDTKITSYQAKIIQDNATAISTANNRLIQAEIKSLEGYDIKLVSKLIDKSDVKVNEDGSVTGIAEALAKLEAEFPQVKVVAPAQPGANPPPQGDKTLKDEYDDIKAKLMKNPGNSTLMQQLFLIKEKMK